MEYGIRLFWGKDFFGKEGGFRVLKKTNF